MPSLVINQAVIHNFLTAYFNPFIRSGLIESRRQRGLSYVNGKVSPWQELPLFDTQIDHLSRTLILSKTPVTSPEYINASHVIQWLFFLDLCYEIDALLHFF